MRYEDDDRTEDFDPMSPVIEDQSLARLSELQRLQDQLMYEEEIALRDRKVAAQQFALYRRDAEIAALAAELQRETSRRSAAEAFLAVAQDEKRQADIKSRDLSVTAELAWKVADELELDLQELEARHMIAQETAALLWQRVSALKQQSDLLRRLTR